MQVVTIAGEGTLDLQVAEKLVSHYGGEVGNRYYRGGKSGVDSKIAGYNNDAMHTKMLWLVLRDLNSDECPPSLRNKLLSETAPSMCFRIAEKEVESWLMGDRESLAFYFRVSRDLIPLAPEEIDEPKELIVKLAKKSNKREIREGIARKGSTQLDTGPRYTALMREYAQTHWRPEVAAKRSDSLRRAMACIEKLLKQAEFAG